MRGCKMYRGSSSITLFDSWLATSARSEPEGGDLAATESPLCRLADEDEEEGRVATRADILGGGRRGAAPGSGYSRILSLSKGRSCLVAWRVEIEPLRTLPWGVDRGFERCD